MWKFYRIFIEIFNYKTLKKTHLEAKLPSEREHVSFYMWKSGKFKTKRYDIEEDYSKYRFTLDYKEDFKLICSLIDFFGKSITSVNMHNIIDFIKKNPKKIIYQKNIYRTIGYKRAFQRDKKFTNG